MTTTTRFYRFCLFWALLLLLSVRLCAEDRAVPTTYSSWLETVNAPYAWNLGFTGKNVVVGVIDDSIDMAHPFFSSNIDTSQAYNTGVIYNNEAFKTLWPDLPTQPVGDSSAFWDRAIVEDPDISIPGPSQFDYHGTSVTGCIASYDAATNTYGPAYGASIVPIRVDFPCQLLNAKIDGVLVGEMSFAQAIAYNNNTIDIKNNSYGSSAGYVIREADLKLAAIADARENNTILLYSSGNERNKLLYPNGKDCDKKMFTAHPYTITVAATGKGDTADYTGYAPFSDCGSCVFIAAPGVGIPTADREDIRTGNVFTYNCDFISDFEYQGSIAGNRNEDFGGTSASCPVATGVLALTLEAYQTTYPGQVCDVRFIKHLLARTSTKIDLEATKRTVIWLTNAAGFSFSPSYGFGQINAQGLIDAILDPETTLGGHFDTVTPQTIATMNWSTLEMTPEEMLIYRSTVLSLQQTGGSSYMTTFGTSESGIPTPVEIPLDAPIVSAAAGDGVVYSETKTFTDETFLNAGITKQPLEEVVVTLTIKADDPEIGFDARYLEIMLDHNGLESCLAFSDEICVPDNIDDLTWSFTSNAFWGEDPTGDWTLSVYNVGTNDTFNVTDVFSTFYMGTLLNSNLVPEPSAWLLLILGAGGLVCYRKKEDIKK